MIEQLKNDKMLISYCGICCSLCPGFRSEECPGCEELSDCKIHICAEEKNNRYCFLCEEFPCDLFEKGFDWDLNEYSNLKEFNPGIVRWKPFSNTYIKLFKMMKKSKNK